MPRRRPPITAADVLRLREHCLEREAKGNKPGGSFTDNVDLRRDIIFYHNASGNWYLRRDWRITFNQRYPAYAVDEQSTLKPRKRYPSRRALDDMIFRLQYYDRSLCWIRRGEGKWWVVRTTLDAGYRAGNLAANTYISEEYSNSVDAYESLEYLYDLFSHSCAQCGCDWRETNRYKDAGDRWHCPRCHTTPENSDITGAEPGLSGGVTPDMEPMLGGAE